MIFSSRPAARNQAVERRFDSDFLGSTAKPRAPSDPVSPVFDVADLTEIAHDELRQQFREHDGHRDRLQCRQAGQ